MYKIKIVFFSFLFLLVIVVCGLQSASAAVPHLINYQGRLTDTSGKSREGAHNVTFRIYDAETAGTLLWEETQSVIVQKGIFSVLLGGATNLNLPFDKQYFLEIKVNNEVLIPRQRIAGAAYAMNAENGVPKGAIIIWSGKIADIPSGWALCDGMNGTPDLRDRFIVGARQDDGGAAKTNISGALTQNGGSAMITEANLPSHAHNAGALATASEGAHTHALHRGEHGGQEESFDQFGGGWYSRGFSATGVQPAGAHAHAIIGLTASTGLGTSYAPPYYALAYIMKL